MSRYLKIMRHDAEVPKKQPKVDAVRTRDVGDMCLALVEPELTESEIHLAALFALCLHTGAPIGEVRPTRPEHVAVTDFDVRVALPNGTIAIINADGSDIDRAVRCWITHPNATQLSNHLQQCTRGPIFRRAGLPVPGVRDPIALSDTDARWLLRGVDRRLEANLRNRAYLLTAFFTALRHISLARLKIADVRIGVGVVTLAVGATKTDPEGLWGDKVLRCQGEGTWCGQSHCPACTLRDWLTYLERHGRSGPLFATFYAQEYRQMTRQNACLILKALWVVIGGDEEARIATRSTRAGCATSAYEAGLDIEEIATKFTNHKVLSEAGGYVRVSDEGIYIRPPKP